MSQVQAQARHRQRIEALCLATIQALSCERDLHFRGRRLHRGRVRLPLYAAHLHPDIEREDVVTWRGAADGLALRLSRSNDALHKRLAPAGRVERVLFDLLEQFRVESLAGDERPGVQRNLQQGFDAWLRAFHHAGLTESASGLLMFTVAQVSHARVTQQPVLEETEDLMEATRAGIAPLIGHSLAALRRARADQAAYAVHALAIAAEIARLLAEAGEGEDTGSRSERAKQARLAFGLLADADEDVQADAAGRADTGRERKLQASTTGYRVFTNAYDAEVRPERQVRAAVLDAHRQRLDLRIAEQGVNIPRLASRLHAVLAVPSREGWASAREEGLIDGRRLAQLVASPTERRLFRQAVREPQADCVVGFLIDCSGSMRQHIESVALLVDVFARALDLAGVASEVLGFTTGAWNGGRAMRDWQRAGRPLHPGRLNEVAHLVFKDGDTPWRRARRGIAALLRAELFREGVDGEALAWAASRLAARGEARRVLIVISDGCPMDGATQLANGPDVLDQHLQQVAARIEGDGVIELAALGVGLDLSLFYARCQAIDLDAGLGNRVFDELLALIGGRP